MMKNYVSPTLKCKFWLQDIITDSVTGTYDNGDDIIVANPEFWN